MTLFPVDGSLGIRSLKAKGTRKLEQPKRNHHSPLAVQNGSIFLLKLFPKKAAVDLDSASTDTCGWMQRPWRTEPNGKWWWWVRYCPRIQQNQIPSTKTADKIFPKKFFPNLESSSQEIEDLECRRLRARTEGFQHWRRFSEAGINTRVPKQCTRSTLLLSILNCFPGSR